jgi:hypothetical protein
VVALALVVVGLSAASGLAWLGVLGVDAAVVDVLGTAAAAAVTVFLLLGVLQLLVLASANERWASEVAETAAELEAPEKVAQTAEELETSADEVERVVADLKTSVEKERERLPTEDAEES